MIRFKCIKDSQHEGLVVEVVPLVEAVAALGPEVAEYKLLAKLLQEVSKQELLIYYNLNLLWQLIEHHPALFVVHKPVLVV